MNKFIVLFISLYIFSACGMESKKTNDNTSTAYKTLLENKKRWKDAQTKNYSFVVKKSCFCPHEENIQSTIDNEKVIESKYIPSNIPINIDNKQKSIEEYFNIIEEAINENVYKIIVDYDLLYGYPKMISIDYDEQMVDEQISYLITHFTPTIDGRIICTQEYTPVCASVNIQCITQPCETVEETFPNKCMLNANPNATYIRDGEC